MSEFANYQKRLLAQLDREQRKFIVGEQARANRNRLVLAALAADITKYQIAKALNCPTGTVHKIAERERKRCGQ